MLKQVPFGGRAGSPRGTDFESPRAFYNLIGIGQLTSAGRNLDAITSSPIGRLASPLAASLNENKVVKRVIVEVSFVL